jgi:hypothetical protein
MPYPKIHQSASTRPSTGSGRTSEPHLQTKAVGLPMLAIGPISLHIDSPDLRVSKCYGVNVVLIIARHSAPAPHSPIAPPNVRRRRRHLDDN